jgi:hypothetical protein
VPTHLAQLTKRDIPEAKTIIHFFHGQAIAPDFRNGIEKIFHRLSASDVKKRKIWLVLIDDMRIQVGGGQEMLKDGSVQTYDEMLSYVR